jgi:hypothetical protein
MIRRIRNWWRALLPRDHCPDCGWQASLCGCEDDGYQEKQP